MASVEQRLQMKREPLDKWSIREQLCLASAVARSGDQNWMSVSRALKQFGEPNRPSDWFHQKNCAAQYGALLSNVETPKRKKRTSSSSSLNSDYLIETPGEAILRQLKTERINELKKLLNEEKQEYLKLQEDMQILNSGNFTEEQLDKWCREIDEEEFKKEHEAIKHSQWLKERETRKLEIERAWRPLKLTTTPPTLKRKSLDDPVENHENSEKVTDEKESVKTTSLALSPLLTSLLKSPSQVQNINQQQQSSILHSAITNQRNVISSNSSNISTNPMITSLLNTSTTNANVVTVSPAIQQMVTSAINQPTIISEIPSAPELIDDETLRNLKIEEIANSMIVQDDGPLPEMKNDVDVIISDLIADPEQHLEIDNNGDININLELDDLEEEEFNTENVENEMKVDDKEVIETVNEVKESEIKETPTSTIIDPFEFQEDPDFEPKLKTINTNNVPIQQNEEIANVSSDDVQVKEEIIEETSAEAPPVSTTTTEVVEIEVKETEEKTVTEKPETSTSVEIDLKIEVKEEIKENKIEPETNETFSEIYDEDVKMDKEKAKRDYSRTTKKKEDKDIDLLLAIEKSQSLDDELDDELSDDQLKPKDEIKSENERSNSPWTEEDEIITTTTTTTPVSTVSTEQKQRRFSTPVSDSVPNSPSNSLILNDDDKEYRNWKKSIMLVYSWLAAHKYSSLFLKPITEEQAPGYKSLIYRPMDFQTIRKNIENGTVRTTIEFKRDVMLMLNNAIMYNKTNGTVYNMTREIQQEAMESIRLLLQAQTRGDTPPRRETRTSEPSLKRKRGVEDNLRNKKRKED